MRVKTLDKHPFILLATLLIWETKFFFQQFFTNGQPEKKGRRCELYNLDFLGKMGQSHHSNSRIFYFLKSLDLDSKGL